MRFFIHYVSFILGVISLVLIIIAGPGSRIGIYPFTIGIAMMITGALIGIGAVIISAVALITGTHSLPYTIAGLVMGAVSSGIIIVIAISASKVPVIHDISTDTVNVPEFVSILALRKNAANPAVYGGPEIAKKQLSAYPDIKTIHSGMGAEEAFKKSSAAARSLGWEIVDENMKEGRIEAFDTTLMFGFKDDIVIRILSHAEGSIIDMRSVSRVGSGDLGTNAGRIRKFMKIFN